MKKFLSIMITVAMLLSFAGALPSVKAADAGMHINPIASPVTALSFQVSGTFDASQPSINCTLSVSITGFPAKTYNFTASGSTWGPVTVSTVDFPGIVTDGSQTYVVTLAAIGLAVPFPVLTDPMNINWAPNTVVPTNYTLTTNVAPAGSGSVTLNPVGGTYAAGTVVTLTANPAAGYYFASWSGDLTGSANPTTITMNANKTVTANFSLTPPPTCITITDADKKADHLYYYDPVPNFGSVGTVNDLTKKFVYKMGDVIHGYIDIVPTAPWRIELRTTTGAVVDSVAMAAGSKYFTIGTGNVSYDGEYYVVAVVNGQDYCSQKVFVEYNLTWGAKTLNNCAGTQTISGWITRGNGQTVLVPVVVSVAYPDNTLAGRYVITPYSSGQFTIQFPADGPDADNKADIGKFRVYISDGYDPANDDNDEIVYDTLNNIPTVSMTVSTYITPFIYKSTNNQPLLLVVKDQDENPVTGLLQADWTVTNATVVGYSEISPGFYRFVLNVGSAVDVRFRATKSFYGSTVTSNQIILDTRTIDVFNPYIDITAPDAIAPYGDGTPWKLDSQESVFDKLPCTVGNSFEIKVDAWPVKDPANWYVYDQSWSVEGPVVDETGASSYGFGDTMKVLVTQSGKISVTIDAIVWERVNKDCPEWPLESETDMSLNACCHTYEKTVDICEVKSCTYGGVTLSGANVSSDDPKTVEVGKKVDKVSVSIDPTGAPTDLTCSCPNYVVFMYMVDGSGALVKNAFTVDTWGGTSVKGSTIWYNPQGVTGPGIADQPVQVFQKSGIYDVAGNLVSNSLKFVDCPFGLQGVTFNYPTDTSCGYTLVVKVFGLSRTFDACGNMITKYPMIAEEFDPITVTPTAIDLTSTYTLTEGTADPDQMLAGVTNLVDVTITSPTGAPGFSYDKGDTTYWQQPTWKFSFNGKALPGITVTASQTGTASYRFVLSKPFSSDGTFKIVGTSYYYDCTKKEVVTIEIEVVKPEFTVSIGLKDCDKTVIDSDGILTEGFDELVYVKAVDPRGVHDFSTDPNWQLSASAAVNDCGLPAAKVCYAVEGPGCAYGLPMRVVGYDNPNLTDDPTVNVYFNLNGSKIKVTSLKLVPPTIKVEPTEVPFTIPATATHITFTVTDAHGHNPSDIGVQVLNVGSFGAGASGYSWSASAGVTGCKGEVDWAFTPPFSGKYVIKAVPTLKLDCPLPCGWLGINTTATFEAVYKAPVVDTEAPKVEVTAPAEVTTSTVKITGKATDNVGVVSVWVGAKQASVAPDGTFEAVLDLVAGDNTFTVSAYDAANNVGTKSVTVKYVVPQVTKIVLKIGSDIMTVNGQAVQLDAAAEIKNGSTFLPLRAIAEAFGAQVTWVPETQGITVVLGDTQIGLQIGNNTAVINGNVISIVAPYIKNSRTMVPFRVISEAFGAKVDWDPVNYIVTVTMQG